MSQSTATLSATKKTYLRTHADWIDHLPESRFEHGDVPDACPLKRLQRIDAVAIVDTRENAQGREVNVYRVTREAREYVEGLERTTLLPCGHAGLENHGQYFTCSFELCEAQFGRGEVGE